MSYRRHHEESGFGGVETTIQPIRAFHAVDHPEFLGGCDLWESWDSWHHGISTPLSCGNVQ
jgi:hypothetical protein